jgi:hypothetical protein
LDFVTHPLVIGLMTVAAVVTALKVITTWKPVQWLLVRFLKEPAEVMFEHTIIKVVQPQLDIILHEVTLNGGGSLKDMLRELQGTIEIINGRMRTMETAFDNREEWHSDGNPEP